MKKMMYALLFAVAAMFSSAPAAVITLSEPVDAMHTSVLDVELNNPNYTFVEGVTYGSGAKTFTTAGGNTITLATNNANLGIADMPAATPSATSGWYNGGSQWNNALLAGSTDVVEWTDALKGNLWHNDPSDAARPLTLHLAGLTVGQRYAVQLYSADARYTDREQAYWSSFAGGVFSGGSSVSFSENPAYKVSGTFVADAAYQDIFVQATDGIGNTDTTIAAYTLYAVMAPSVGDPDPAMGQIDVSIDKVLSWSAPEDPNLDPAYTITYDIYIDPNATNVATGSSSCAYKSLGQTGTTYNPTPDLAYSTTYYWAVDAHAKFDDRTEPNVLDGSVWSFRTVALNTAPVVDAGQSIVTWLAEAQAGLALTSSTLIDNESDAVITWAVVPSLPAIPAGTVNFDDTSVLHPVVTIGNTGVYRLKVTANDGVNPAAADYMQITVYADACEAAKNNPNAAYVKNAYDFDNNCVVNLEDFNMFAAQWLEDTYLTSSQSYALTVTGPDILLWLDASDAATLVKDGSNKVSRWNDKSGRGYYFEQTDSTRQPTYVASDPNFSGNPVVDFGNVFATVAAGGNWMGLKNASGTDGRLTTIRTVFWVMRGANNLLCDNTASDFHRHRGSPDNGTLGPTNNIWDGGWAAANVRNGTTYLNGVSVNGTTTALPLIGSLVSLITSGNCGADRLCKDRTYRCGGQQIAEIIVFERALTTAERQSVEAYLKGKWGTP